MARAGESLSLLQLHQRGQYLSRVIEQRTSLFERIGTEGEVQFGTSIDNSLKAGNARRSVDASRQRAEAVFETVNQEISGRADEYQFLIHRQEGQLAQLEDLVAQGFVPEETVAQHRHEYEEFRALPERNEYLRRGIERLRGGEVSEGIEPPPTDEREPEFALSNGTVLHYESAQLLTLLSESTNGHGYTVEALAQQLFPGIFAEEAKRRVYNLVSQVRKSLRGSDRAITTIRQKGEQGIYRLVEASNDLTQSGK